MKSPIFPDKATVRKPNKYPQIPILNSWEIKVTAPIAVVDISK